jgi:hypothetical protein
LAAILIAHNAPYVKSYQSIEIANKFAAKIQSAIALGKRPLVGVDEQTQHDKGGHERQQQQHRRRLAVAVSSHTDGNRKPVAFHDKATRHE